MRRSKVLLILMAAMLFLSVGTGGSAAFASTLKDLQNKQKNVEKQKQTINSTIHQKERAIQNNKSTIDSIMDQIFELNAQIEETNKKISNVEDLIEQTTHEIEVLQASIKDLEKKIAERDEVLKERFRAMQVNGTTINYIDVLLGANSFADFIDRFSAVNTLMEADKDIMKQQAEDKKKLEEEKALVEQKLQQQEQNRKDLQALKDSLVSKKSEKNRLIDQLEAEQEKLEQEKSKLQEDLHDAHEVSKELEQAIIKEQKRLAEIARKAEEERKKREAAKRAAAKKNSGGSGGGGSASAPSVSSGIWTKPASGTYTSSFGWRTHPIYGYKKQHRGADIANAVGTPIYAAGDGVVSYAGPMGTYGNVIMITHSVNGKIYTTVYAHLSSISVSSGQGVDKGQFIGRMGSTGASTGSHLHFEFHIGNWTADGPSAVNPLRYVPF